MYMQDVYVNTCATPKYIEYGDFFKVRISHRAKNL